MQSYDFYGHWQETLDCQDQNSAATTSGPIFIVRRRITGKKTLGKDSYYGMTFSLLTNTAKARRWVKLQKGALWLDAEKTTPYEFYQYWRNVDDADVEQMPQNA